MGFLVSSEDSVNNLNLNNQVLSSLDKKSGMGTISSQLTFTCSKSTIETVQQDVKDMYVQLWFNHENNITLSLAMLPVSNNKIRTP